MKRVVIVGGGFAGIYAAMYLIREFYNSKDVEIALINKNNYFLFSPMLHEVATGGLNRYHIVEPIREVLCADNFKFYKSIANRIDFRKRMVYIDSESIPYDYLVIAIGATTNFFNVPGAEKYCLSLKDIKDAAMVRDRMISSFEAASMEKDKSRRRNLLSFIVIGGGPTGVELAGEMIEYAKQLQSRCAGINESEVNVYLIHSKNELIPIAHRNCRADAAKALQRKGVTLLLDSKVTKVGVDYVEINKKNRLYAETKVWTSGVRPNYIETMPRVADDKNFFHVDNYLAVRGLKNVYAIGDVALAFNPNDNKPIPMLAQVATKEAKVAAKNIIADIKGRRKRKFVFNSSGFLVSIGQKYGVAEVKGIRFKGFFAWWLWRTIYLFKLLGFANKFRVAYDWTLNLFFKRDTSEI